MKKNIYFFILITILSGWSVAAVAQEFPVYSQYFLNPYLYNPSFAGQNGYTEIFLMHRRQWTEIAEAPVTSAFTLQVPTRDRVSIGFTLYNDQTVLLSSTSFLGTFAYQVPITHGQQLVFGLSAGMGINAFDLSEADNPNDPALYNARNNNLFWDGQFGMHYGAGNFTLGFALPKLFINRAVDDTNISEFDFSPLDNFIVSSSLRIQPAGKTIAFEPYLLYRYGKAESNQIEAAGIFHFNDKLRAGASYRHNYGVTAFAGVTMNGNIDFSYAYEIVTGDIATFSGSTHEITLSTRLGNKKTNAVHPKNWKPGAKTTHWSDIKRRKTSKKPERSSPVVTEKQGTSEVAQHQEAKNEEEEDYKRMEGEISPSHPDEYVSGRFITLKPGYYLVGGVYQSLSAAEKASEHIFEQTGLVSRAAYWEAEKMYVIYFSENKQAEGMEKDVKRIRPAFNWERLEIIEVK